LATHCPNLPPTLRDVGTLWDILHPAIRARKILFKKIKTKNF
jgi:hypothetical protein